MPLPKQDTRLESVLDSLRDRFGEGVVKRGSDLLGDDEDESNNYAGYKD